MRFRDFFSPGLLFLALPLLHAEPIPVRYSQGSGHVFLALKTQEGATIAIGDVIQVAHGDRVTSRLTFRFTDGSLDDETTVFTQRKVFKLVSDHHVQRGPSFPKPIDVLIEAATGQITTRAEDGKTTQEHMDLPADVYNGLPPNLLMNLLPSATETKISFVAPGSSPRLIRLSMKNVGSSPFNVAGVRRNAINYLVHIELGGLTGVVAPIIGKQPADLHIWILGGTAPAFIREEGQLYEGGPIWIIEPISGVFPR